MNKAGLNLAIFLAVSMITAAVVSGCGSANNPKQNTSSSIQGQSNSSTNHATASTLYSNVKNKDAASSTNVNIANEKPVAPEVNPPGDIPDTQAFVKYSSSAGGYELQVPEGWARTENGGDVIFTDKFDGLQVHLLNAAGPVTLESIKNNQVADLVKTGRAVTVKNINEANLSGGQAFIVSYDSNSDPNPVTNKQIRLENQNFYFFKNGKMAVVKVWAPLGADNVDQWNHISNNFMWR